MGLLETGTLSIRAKSLEETGDHVSRLSIRCMLAGEQHYKVGSNDYMVHPGNYLVVNQGQHYRTSFTADTEQEMILVAFKPGLAEALMRDMSCSEEELLDDPFDVSSGQLLFFERTYDKDPQIAQLFLQLGGLLHNTCEDQQVDTDAIYTRMLKRLICLHQHLRPEIDRIKSRKQSTRTELYKRLHIARDYMEAHMGAQLRLEDISQAACLSVHHFKRAFSELFGISPHRFLVDKRMQRSKLLLKDRLLTIETISQLSGFADTSAFIRAFRLSEGMTPGQFRKGSMAPDSGCTL